MRVHVGASQSQLFESVACSRERWRALPCVTACWWRQRVRAVREGILRFNLSLGVCARLTLRTSQKHDVGKKKKPTVVLDLSSSYTDDAMQTVGRSEMTWATEMSTRYVADGTWKVVSTGGFPLRASVSLQYYEWAQREWSVKVTEDCRKNDGKTSKKY